MPQVQFSDALSSKIILKPPFQAPGGIVSAGAFQMNSSGWDGFACEIAMQLEAFTNTVKLFTYHFRVQILFLLKFQIFAG